MMHDAQMQLSMFIHTAACNLQPLTEGTLVSDRLTQDVTTGTYNLDRVVRPPVYINCFGIGKEMVVQLENNNHGA